MSEAKTLEPKQEEKNWLQDSEQLLDDSQLGPELLVQMAQKKEIDPWDVDLVYVIDRFLGQLSKKEDKQELKEAARIIFFVSVLLRIKSQNLYVKPVVAPEELGEDYGDLLDFEAIDFQQIDGNAEQYAEMLTPRALDKVLSRNPKGMREARKRKITLDDLLDLFREVESKTSKSKKKKKKSIQDFIDDGDVVIREDEDTDINDLAHDENLEQKIQMLSEYILQKLEIDKETSLSALKDIVGGWADTFLSALFLSHSGKTEISQKIFYEEIWLKRVV